MAKFNLDTLFEQEHTIESGLAGKTILIYGNNNTGKSFVSSKLPKPFFICTEAGAGALNVVKAPCNSWSRFCEIVDALTNEKNLETNKERIQTVVVDTLDVLVDLSETCILEEYEVRDFSEMDSRANGYTLSRRNFKAAVSKLTNVGYCVVFIAHDSEKEMNEIVGNTREKWNYIQPKACENKKSSASFVKDFCDFTLYIKSNGVDEDGKVIKSTAYTAETKYFFARSRYGNPPFAFEFTADNLIQMIEDAVKESAENEGLNLVSFTDKTETYTREDLVNMISEIAKDKNIMAVHGKRVVETVQRYLGDRKLSQTTDADVQKLQDLYNNLILLKM